VTRKKSFITWATTVRGKLRPDPSPRNLQLRVNPQVLGPPESSAPFERQGDLPLRRRRQDRRQLAVLDRQQDRFVRQGL